MTQPAETLDALLSPRFFKALSDPNRLAIVSQLARCCGPTTVSQVAGCCLVNFSVVSRHLATLRDAGILKAEKRGKEVYYSLQVEQVVAQLRALADALETCCPPSRKED